MPKISVVTVSIRPERLDLAKKSLARQSLDDFEWVIDDTQDLKPETVWAFNRATNNALSRCTGELVVFLQDSIYINPEGLEKFWTHYQLNPLACVSGVGDQYDQLDEYGKPTHKVWFDPRKRSDNGTFYECLPQDWEINYGSVPLKLLQEIGGFDEEMDAKFGMDNVAVSMRLKSIGAKFYLDQTNESFSLQHGRRPDWDEKHWMNNGFHDWLAQRPVRQDWLHTSTPTLPK